MHPPRVFHLAALCLAGIGAVTLAGAERKSATPLTTLASELMHHFGVIDDTKYAVYVSLPDDWLVKNAERSRNQSTMISIQLPGETEADANFYYRIYQKDEKSPTDAEAFLRGEAAKKEKDRARLWAGYRNRPDSYFFHQVNGRPALSWIADYKSFDAPWSECLTRVLGEHSVGSFFMNAPTKELEALRPAFNKMVKTVRLP